MMLRYNSSNLKLVHKPIQVVVLMAVACLFGNFSAAVFAWQDVSPESEPRDFRNAKGEVVVTGLLVASDGNKITVAATNGQVEVRLAELDPKDRVWIKEEFKRRKLEREALDVKNELHLADGSGKSHLVYKALRKLRPYGANAHHSGVLLLDLLRRGYLDSKTRQEVLLTYVATTPISPAKSDEVLRYIAGDWDKCGPLVSAAPVDFLTTYARFGDWAEDYLVNVAFTGQLKPKPDQAPPAGPEKTDLVDAEMLANRAAAIRALGELKSERALDIILEAVAVIEKQEPSNARLEAEKLCLEAIVINGITNESVTQLLDRFKERLPEQVERARAKLNKSP